MLVLYGFKSFISYYNKKEKILTQKMSFAVSIKYKVITFIYIYIKKIIYIYKR